ncbi:uncharacterized protein LOC113337540 [Papaver somniferum]|uniref:uncharacterized protein LOC113337540 n=1 Tax=Papaver somniferum TaxID=3469 RepID=UPI000E703171|nr:uncharacterized protein LOC113337540 [Papaver somniferum]
MDITGTRWFSPGFYQTQWQLVKDDGINPNPERTILKARSFISEHTTQINLHHNTTTRVSRRNIHWLSPPDDVVKINIDGSYSYSNNTGGIGLMVRNFAGEHQAAECIYLTDVGSAAQAECMGLWEAVKLAQSLNMKKVHFELDAKTVVEAVNNNVSIDWQLLNFVKDIQSFFSSFSFWKCSYIPKESNKVADILSKLARENDLSIAWSSYSPLEIRAQLALEKSLVLN